METYDTKAGATIQTQIHTLSFIPFFSHKFLLRANYYEREYITPNAQIWRLILHLRCDDFIANILMDEKRG